MNVITDLATLLLAAIFVERVVEHFVKPYVSIKLIVPIAMLLGIFVAFVYHIDFMASVGLQSVAGWQWASFLFSGVVVGGGSNFVNDLISTIPQKKSE